MESFLHIHNSVNKLLPHTKVMEVVVDVEHLT
jgi:hypothetical protein